MIDAKGRFSSRVENYRKYRPSYPAEALEHLRREAGMVSEATVADIGSGTGIFTRLVCERVKRVYAVEPNKEMRESAEELFAGAGNVVSVNGSAEATTLPDQGVDLIVAAQAFHWFDRAACRTEFRRILRPGGKVVLLWNNRLTDTPFLEEYDALLCEYGIDYAEVNHRNLTDDEIAGFLRPFNKKVIPHRGLLSSSEFEGRLLSSSYVPLPGQANHEILMAEMRGLFRRFAADGKVAFRYETVIYWGGVE